MMSDLNLGNSLFQGYNDQNGLMICGYEWGWSKADEAAYEAGELHQPETETEHTFANRARHYGEQAKKWRYDNAVKKWFELWGHPLDENDLGGAFEKSIVLTNWAATQGNQIDNKNKFIQPEHIENFLYHIEKLRPKVILFMGSRLMDYLNHRDVLPRFKQIVGEQTAPLKVEQKASDGTRFKVRFQSFEHCEVVCLPHPSASRGLSDKYIALFEPEMNRILSDFKTERGFR
ncbi:hypothetical protein [Neisseria sp.]|uniref:hypothetical protein n=1 Tax=Neisseria sp. TaxID=192066 RepID=UPI0035A132DD